MALKSDNCLVSCIISPFVNGIFLHDVDIVVSKETKTQKQNLFNIFLFIFKVIVKV